MPQPVAVVFVHGIHTLEPGYQQAMQTAIEARLPPRLRELVTFEPVFWAEHVRRRQKLYRDAVAEQGLFRDGRFRRLVVQGLGDAAAYQKTKSYKNSAYYEIQSEVRKAIEKLDADGPPDRPLIFIAHSLGCHIVSSFIWDVNTIKNWDEARIARADEQEQAFANYLKGGSPFRRLDTAAGLVMMGSNMPLFTFTFGPDKIMPITVSRNAEDPAAFPGAALAPATLGRVRWDNYYSRNDLLGYPLKPLNAAYAREPLLRDIEVASEGWWQRAASIVLPKVASAFTYGAHTGYWTNRRVVRGATDLITAIATAGDEPASSRFAVLKRLIPGRSG